MFTNKDALELYALDLYERRRGSVVDYLGAWREGFELQGSEYQVRRKRGDGPGKKREYAGGRRRVNIWPTRSVPLNKPWPLFFSRGRISLSGGNRDAQGHAVSTSASAQ